MAEPNILARNRRYSHSGIRLSTNRLLLAASIVSACAPFVCAAPPGKQPDLGSNVLVVTPDMPVQLVQQKIDAIYTAQEHSQFGPRRDAILFLPGKYQVDVPVGYYTQVLGLGASPDDVQIVGNVHADASLPHNNATCTFWRGVEGFSVAPAGGAMQWAVSQAVFFRRMHVRGNLVLHQHRGWASGGWISDSLIDGNVDSGSQQQWISRNTDWKSWTGSNWNMVFVGVNRPPNGTWPKPPYTTIPQTPVVREKPFLMVDSKGNWSVLVPELRRDSIGITWGKGQTPGRSIPLSSFYIAHAGDDSAASINAQLAKGKSLLLTPGIYQLAEPIRITHPNTIVLGLGFATLKPMNGTPAMTTADVDGIDIAGVLFDAGPKESHILLQVGPVHSAARHAQNPIVLHDVFFRVGGAAVGKAHVNLEINANGTIVDHTWIWRADHGNGVGWNLNTSDYGLIVNADDVTAYGLFVEHHQKFQVLWNGNRGRTYFYQSEIPYDPPNQQSFTSAKGVNGWASYKVADSVTSHEAWGLGIYSVFLKPNVSLSRAIEAPNTPGVRFHHMITVALGNLGEISNVINDKGGPTSIHPRVTPQVTEYPWLAR
ncbi:MAG TPA: hypothetical protein VG844_16985 [Terracidiphilus sp.]|nr:hypothetical protein [Terracidiphilus sp.]